MLSQKLIAYSTQKQKHKYVSLIQLKLALTNNYNRNRYWRRELNKCNNRGVSHMRRHTNAAPEKKML